MAFPIIANREYKGGILLKEGEPAVVAGMITAVRSEEPERTACRSPKSRASATSRRRRSKQEEDDELLILITPYVVRSPERTEAPEIWMGK